MAGAGPTGLACALELVRLGVPVRVIEKARERAPFSRAIAVNPRTLELLEPTGAAARLRSAARVVPGLVVYPIDGGEIEILFARALGREAAMLALPQNETERLLEETLLERGVAVERGRELIGFDRRDGAVEGLLADGGVIPASFLVGADGARSAVRRLMGARFEGWTDPGKWSLADARLDWPHRTDRAHFFLRPETGLFAIELEPGVVRLVAPRGQALDLLPGGCAVREVVWRSEFDVSYRVAQPMHAGPVALAGDAAHIQSPAGARGMNLGIEDGVLLARRIAKGKVDGWTAERRRVARRVVAMSAEFARLPTAPGALGRFLRRRVAPLGLRLRLAQARLARFVVGLYP